MCGVVAAVLVAVAAAAATGAGQAAVQRTIYVTATDDRGAHFSDLAVMDVLVKDGGRAREVVRVQPSSERLRVAIAVDELLAPNLVVRQAIVRFVQRLQSAGDLALYLVGRITERRVNYSGDVAPFLHAVNAFPAKASYPGNVIEAVVQIARDQQPLEGRRVIVVIAPEISQTSAVTADAALDELRAAGVVLHSATYVGWRTSPGTLQEVPPTRLEGGDLTQAVERDRLLGDGPKQSGGLRLPTSQPDGFGPALERIADDLVHQWRVTYLIPAGGRSDGRINVDANRRNLKLRGPSRLPEVR